MSSRLLIVDDHPMIRSAVAMLLANSDFSVVATAANVEAAIEAVAQSDPDIVILDLAMPGGSGIELLRLLREASNRRPVIILTAAIDDFSLREAMALKVDGIVMKNNDPALLLDCLQAVRAGGHWMDPDLKERAGSLSKSNPFDTLLPRERKLVTLVARGLRNREIADDLGVTEGTVKVYLHAIFEKLGVSSRTELAIRAAEEGPRFQ
jgi:two-component system nitrate/nitrite response regulator NarP